MGSDQGPARYLPIFHKCYLSDQNYTPYHQQQLQDSMPEQEQPGTPSCQAVHHEDTANISVSSHQAHLAIEQATSFAFRTSIKLTTLFDRPITLTNRAIMHIIPRRGKGMFIGTIRTHRSSQLLEPAL